MELFIALLTVAGAFISGRYIFDRVQYYKDLEARTNYSKDIYVPSYSEITRGKNEANFRLK